MAWWSELHYRYGLFKRKRMRPDWREDADPYLSCSDWDCEECCYVHCPKCGKDLFAVIAFKDITPIRLLDFGLEENWPSPYSP